MTARTRKRRFTVELEPPPGATTEDLVECLTLAIQSYPGSLHPQDPMFELDRESVKVTPR